MKSLQLITTIALALSPIAACANRSNAQAVNKEQQDKEVSATMTPAERHQKRTADERIRDNDTEVTPRMKARSETQKFPTEHHKKAYHSLSEKNRKAYEGLEDHEQDRVAETYRQGGNHQKTLTKILKDDQKDHEKTMSKKSIGGDTYQHDEGMQDSPATRTMKKQEESQQQKKPDNIFD